MYTTLFLMLAIMIIMLAWKVFKTFLVIGCISVVFFYILTLLTTL